MAIETGCGCCWCGCCGCCCGCCCHTSMKWFHIYAPQRGVKASNTSLLIYLFLHFYISLFPYFPISIFLHFDIFIFFIFLYFIVCTVCIYTIPECWYDCYTRVSTVIIPTFTHQLILSKVRKMQKMQKKVALKRQFVNNIYILSVYTIYL